MDSDSDLLRVHVRVAGRVQGVCYRWYTRDTAAEHGVTGWVRNLPDGSVELVAEGRREGLAKLLEWCRKGPQSAKVSDMEVRWEEGTGEFDQFYIRH